MNSHHKLYAYTSPGLTGSPKEKQENESQYFQFLQRIKNRENKFLINSNKYQIKKGTIEPFKDPEVQNENKKHKTRLFMILDEPALPKLNIEYLETKKLLSRNKKLYRDIEERALTFENIQFMKRLRNQKTSIEEFKISKKINCGLDTSRVRKQKEIKVLEDKKEELILPKIQNKNEKLFQTEINENNNKKKSNDE